MTREEFLEFSPWYDIQPTKIKQLAFEDGYNIGKQEVIEKAAEWLETAINGDNIEGCKDSNKLIEDFKKYMEI